MSIRGWLLKPLVQEAVRTAMKEFFNNYFTKGMILFVLIINGAALLLGVSSEALSSFNVLAGGLTGLNVLRSGVHAIANKNNHAQ